MKQDLRDLFEKERKQRFRMKEGHEQRFLDLLNKELPNEKKRIFPIWAIAAGFALLIGTAFYFAVLKTSPDPVPTTIVSKEGSDEANPNLSLGDLSPDLRKLENYYVANINLEIAQLEVSPENKALVDSFMDRLAELNREYASLNEELNSLGPNDQTITALIRNLQLRLELLYKLKDKLNDLKSSKNEQVTSNKI